MLNKFSVGEWLFSGFLGFHIQFQGFQGPLSSFQGFQGFRGSVDFMYFIVNIDHYIIKLFAEKRLYFTLL